MAGTRALRLSVQPGRLAVCRLSRSDSVPAWLEGPGFTSVSRTADELSIVCDQGRVPAAVRHEAGWRALKLAGPYAFSETGVLSSVLGPLAEATVPIFAVSTFDTDYVLVKEDDLARALAALGAAGHQVD